MKQVQFDATSTVAWFKLAECIARGEKERALSVYRLLSHSLGDSAYAQQLEGDIFLSCNDAEFAVKKYESAATLYKKKEQFLRALHVYEKLHVLAPDNVWYLEQLVELSKQLKLSKKATLYKKFFK